MVTLGLGWAENFEIYISNFLSLIYIYWISIENDVIYVNATERRVAWETVGRLALFKQFHE